MKDRILDVIVIGAGPAGLSTSYFLKRNGLTHVVFERGNAGESWRSQRWNSFRLNSPNRLNELPGNNYFENDTEGFCTSSDYVSSLKEYIDKFQLSVLENANVKSVDKQKGTKLFTVDILTDEGLQTYYSQQLVVASGYQSEAKVPNISKNIPLHVHQLHASEYRDPKHLVDGNILVVGSAQSGCQIADDLADAGRRVYLSTSMVARVPRHYRGKDIHDWLLEMNFFEVRKEQVTDPAQLYMKAPQLTGVGQVPKTISLQSLAKKGVSIVGKLDHVNGEDAIFQSNAGDHVKFADGFSARVKNMIDDFVSKNGLIAPDAQYDEEDVPDTNTRCLAGIQSLNLKKENVNTIIWATGFSSSLKYLKLPVLDNEGTLLQRDGMSEIEGLYFLGFPWLRKYKSSLICGIREDAEFIAREVNKHSLRMEKELI
jgi:putative flavoprotein involved in K+ transport